MTTLRETADALGLTVTQPYRIGLGWDLDRLRAHLARPQHRWRGIRFTLKLMAKSACRRSWWGFWQCEGSLGLRARRGLTARAAERRMLRDEINAALGGQGYQRGASAADTAISELEERAALAEQRAGQHADTVARVRQLHSESPHTPGLCCCANPYPCPTIRALDPQEADRG